MKQRKMKNIAKRQYDKKFKMSWLDFRVALNLRLEEKTTKTLPNFQQSQYTRSSPYVYSFLDKRCILLVNISFYYIMWHEIDTP